MTHLSNYKQRDKKRFKARYGMKMDRSIFVIKNLHKAKKVKK